MEKETKTEGKFLSFLKKKGVTLSPKVYFIDAMGAMAYGLFASLLIGTIFGTLGTHLGWEFFNKIAEFAKGATGAALGAAIAYSLGAPKLVLLSAIGVGIAGNTLGGPVGAYIAVIIATELGKIVSGETKVDILVTPITVLASGIALSILVGPGINALMNGFGALIMEATNLQPVFMGIVVSALVGIALTLPISSAAICVMLELGGLAAGAATAGCCAQMIGFAVMSFHENKWGGLLAQGLGTSMLQMPNIIKNPKIWIPPTLASMITGPLATAVFGLQNIPVGAGMGTCGLVGPIGILTAMDGSAMMWIGIVLICFVLPALLSLLFCWILRKIGWIKPGDLTLPKL